MGTKEAIRKAWRIEMANVISRLKVVKDTIAQKQRDLDRLEGRRDTLLKTLKDNHGLDSVEAAEKEIERLDKSLDAEERDIEAKLDELEKQIGVA